MKSMMSFILSKNLISVASSRDYWACFERPINITYQLKFNNFTSLLQITWTIKKLNFF